MNPRNYVPVSRKRELLIDAACAIALTLLAVASGVLLAWRG